MNPESQSAPPGLGALGVDAHVIRDDGTDWRVLPWGRDGKESLIGRLRFFNSRASGSRQFYMVSGFA